MKQIASIFLLFLSIAGASAQTNADYDNAVGKFQGLYNRQQGDSIVQLMSDRINQLSPGGNASAMFTQVHQQLGAFRTFSFMKQDQGIHYYKSDFDNGTFMLAAVLTAGGRFDGLRFLPYQADTVKEDGTAITLKTATGDLYGTLTLPASGGRVPVVLIIAGSGPTDRNGNSPLGVKANSYAMLADSLRAAGIATVRYDKRGIAGSAAAVKKEADMSFDDEVNDAEGFIKMLKADSRFGSIYVAGHSMGSLVGILAVNKEKVNGLISIAGVAERADNIIYNQIYAQDKDGAHTARMLMDSLREGYTIKNYPESMSSLFRPSLALYMHTWLKYDPAKELKKLAIPVLIVQGTHDIQVDAAEAEKLKKADAHATLLLIDGMNHILKQAPEDRQQNMATYADATLPLSPGLVPGIVKFIKSSR